MSIATNAWARPEADPQRRELLAAADRLLAGTPQHSTGNLSIVQLAAEAQVKYWVVAQKHTDLRDHFQRLAAEASTVHSGRRESRDTRNEAATERDELQQHCTNLEQLVTLYATALNELALENHALRDQAQLASRMVTPLIRRPSDHQP
jgi:hypothetical protein